MMVAGNFYKTSYNKFLIDCKTLELTDEETIRNIWSNIIRPKRIDENRAAYTFYLPYSRCLQKDETIKILTGVGLDILPGWVLVLKPRKEIVFVENDENKYLMSTAGNNTHLIVKIKSKENFSLAEGDPYMYGTFLQYGVALSEKEF